jgi:hypothetical protein
MQLAKHRSSLRAKEQEYYVAAARAASIDSFESVGKHDEGRKHHQQESACHGVGSLRESRHSSFKNSIQVFEVLVSSFGINGERENSCDNGS